MIVLPEPSTLMQEKPSRMLNPCVILLLFKHFASNRCTFFLHGTLSLPNGVPVPTASVSVLRARASPRDLQPALCKWDQFWDESGPLYHTFCITVPGTQGAISCWQVAFIRNLSVFWKKLRGVRTAAFCATRWGLILRWMNNCRVPLSPLHH